MGGTLIIEGGLLIIFIDCMIFLSPFLDVTRMSMSKVSFLAQLGPGILCLYNAFNCRFFLDRFPVCFNLFVLLFPVTPCLVKAVQPCKA